MCLSCKCDLLLKLFLSYYIGAETQDNGSGTMICLPEPLEDGNASLGSGDLMCVPQRMSGMQLRNV